MAEGGEDSYTLDVTSVQTNRRVCVGDIEASLFSEGEERYPIACREEFVGTSGCQLEEGHRSKTQSKRPESQKHSVVPEISKCPMAKNTTDISMTDMLTLFQTMLQQQQAEVMERRQKDMRLMEAHECGWREEQEQRRLERIEELEERRRVEERRIAEAERIRRE